MTKKVQCNFCHYVSRRDNVIRHCRAIHTTPKVDIFKEVDLPIQSNKNVNIQLNVDHIVQPEIAVITESQEEPILIPVLEQEEPIGFVYCFSNVSMPGILKVGMTRRTPEARLRDANSTETWRPPTPYQIEVVKRVRNPKQKETLLHSILSAFAERINERREFFKVSIEYIKMLFELME